MSDQYCTIKITVPVYGASGTYVRIPNIDEKDVAIMRACLRITDLEQALESIAAHSPSERDREIALKALGREIK